MMLPSRTEFWVCSDGGGGALDNDAGQPTSNRRKKSLLLRSVGKRFLPGREIHDWKAVHSRKEISEVKVGTSMIMDRKEFCTAGKELITTGKRTISRKSVCTRQEICKLNRRVISYCGGGGGGTATWMLLLLMLMTLMMPIALATTTAEPEHNCDVHASGLDRAGREIGTGYVRCYSGRVVWRYPKNGLRVLLSSPVNGREFRGCIKAESNFGGARLMLEGYSSLVPLLDPQDDKAALLQKKPHCFSSTNGQAALYLEAIQYPLDGSFSNNTAAFQYDVELLPHGVQYHPALDCKPCSDEELVSAFCSSDFAATGRLLSITHEQPSKQPWLHDNFLTPSPFTDQGDDHTLISTVLPPALAGDAYLTFAAHEIHRRPKRWYRNQRRSTSSGASSLAATGMMNHRSSTSSSSQLMATTGPMKPEVFLPSRGNGEVVAKVAVPPHCGMRAGPGEYLLIGRFKLGQPVLQCVPRLTLFKSALKEFGDHAPCEIKV